MFQKIIAFALIPLITMIAGGVIAVIKKPGGNLRSLILHFAAGVNRPDLVASINFTLLPRPTKSYYPCHQA